MRAVTAVCGDEQMSQTCLNSGIRIIEVSTQHIDEIGKLMYDSYLNTIDYDNETPEDAKQEVISTFSGKYGELILESSYVAVSSENELISAALFVLNAATGYPLLAFTMTDPRFQGQGLCKLLVQKGLGILANRGQTICELVVTEGNTNALRVYQSLGFETTS